MVNVVPGQERSIFPRSRDRATAHVSRAGSCPVCGRHDAVRQLSAMHQDRRRYVSEPPLVTRYGLMMRGAALLVGMPRSPARVPPPRRPSLVAAYIGLHGLHVPLAAVALAMAAAALIEAGIVVVFAATVGIAFLAGLLGDALRRRGERTWTSRVAEWEKAMDAWRALRYCSRCDHLFGRG